MQVVSTVHATVEGSVVEPQLFVTGVDMYRDRAVAVLLEAQPKAFFDRTRAGWRVTGLQPNPAGLFAAAGVQVDIPAGFDAGSLNELWSPIGVLAPNGREVLVFPRFAGYQRVIDWCGWAAQWDKTVKAIRMPLSDVFVDGHPRPYLVFREEVLTAAAQLYHLNPVLPHNFEAAKQLAYATELPQQFSGLLPSLGRELFEYQKPGSLAVATGHRLLADPPGVGKTVQAIAAAKLLLADRLVVTCPPVIGVNWGRELELALPGLAVTVVSQKTKVDRLVLPESGAVVVPDSLLVSRPELLQLLCGWGADVLIVDEAHRFKNLFSKRTGCVLQLAASVKHRPIVVTGTPILTGVHELVPLLEMTGHLTPVFGGADRFLRMFCSRTKFGKLVTRKRSLPDLNRMLFDWVWVRRERDRVLPFLPGVVHEPLPLEVDRRLYVEAHREALAKVQDWFDAFVEETGLLPSESQVDEFAKQSFSLVSHLRVAAALTKVKAATELVLAHVAEDPNVERPLVVWVHHREVAAALVDALTDKSVPVRLLVGGQSEVERQASIDDFQAGLVPVLVASITAAGVGVTLTRGCDALFVEPDWSAALVAQAVDRQRRIGQQRTVFARTLVALGTLDERVQEVMAEKEFLLESVAGDAGSMNASVLDVASVSPVDIVKGLVGLAAQKHLGVAVG